MVSNSDPDWYARGYCKKVNSGTLYASTGDLTGPASGADDACFLKPGATMYLNVTYTSLEDYRANGGDPVAGCPPPASPPAARGPSSTPSEGTSWKTSSPLPRGTGEDRLRAASAVVVDARAAVFVR